MKSTTWVIVPAYNEGRYLHKVLKKLSSVWDSIIVVDDGSVDQSYKIAEEYTSHVLVHKVNLGKGAALKTGCEYAFNHLNASGVIFFDADDQHDSSLISKMAEQLETYPVVLGIRSFNNQMPVMRIVLNRLASYITLVFFGEYIPDIPCGFKALTREAYQKVKWESSDYLVEMEIAAKIARNKLRFATLSVPTIYHDLDRGMTVLDILHMAGKIITWKVSQ